MKPVAVFFIRLDYKFNLTYACVFVIPRLAMTVPCVHINISRHVTHLLAKQMVCNLASYMCNSSVDCNCVLQSFSSSCNTSVDCCVLYSLSLTDVTRQLTVVCYTVFSLTDVTRLLAVVCYTLFL